MSNLSSVSDEGLIQRGNAIKDELEWFFVTTDHDQEVKLSLEDELLSIEKELTRRYPT